MSFSDNTTSQAEVSSHQLCEMFYSENSSRRSYMLRGVLQVLGVNFRNDCLWSN